MTALHICWLTDPWRDSREKFLRAWNDLGWDVYLWTMQETRQLIPIAERPAMDVVQGSPIEAAFLHAVEHKDHGTAADLFRYQVLTRLGGAYADLDVNPLVGPQAFADRALPGFAVDIRQRLEIRFIRVQQAGDPLLRILRDTAAQNAQAFIDAGGWLGPRASMREVLSRTGPKMAREVVRKWANDTGRRYDHLLLHGMIEERTPEANESHFIGKRETVKQIALERAGLRTTPGPT